MKGAVSLVYPHLASHFTWLKGITSPAYIPFISQPSNQGLADSMITSHLLKNCVLSYLYFLLPEAFRISNIIMDHAVINIRKKNPWISTVNKNKKPPKVASLAEYQQLPTHLFLPVHSSLPSWNLFLKISGQFPGQFLIARGTYIHECMHVGT